ncbi:DUF262 domain-containing protein [[Haemophilus] felis]|uniref:DUF262 domain-containing protein n=1 Tax=[Haemophilus] felis TaxID=123822 RepID=A0A1T0AWE9_9PAST|nr:DUF262 domain-containing protein [[Haemophilus] felis]OOS01859.1 hypothetical protein B0188_09255 [[Haemophilus] felis]
MADLHIGKQTIYELFSGIKNKKFIIPDYQRPYKWDKEKCETLWNDIEQFSDTNPTEDDFYFLGTIVSFENDDKNQEIIDGQQRITSFTLLLRAFYKKLEDATKSDNEIEGLKRQLKPCLWNVNKISGDVDNYSDMKVHSLVIDDEERDIFHSIIETGNVVEEAKDNYSKNYKFFKEQCDKYAMNNPTRWKELYVTILNHCIILPIKCESQDTALTIFSTLNDRGMPLSDSDIFKAKLYSFQKEEEKSKFIDSWKEISAICKKGKVSIDELFRYYSHIIRARNGDTSKEIGLRKFYSQNNYSHLRTPNLLPEIKLLALFWEHINSDIEIRDELKYNLSFESRKYLSCLKCYTNEYWKYVVSVFFIRYKDSSNFDNIFQGFIKKVVSYFLVKYLEEPSVNSIKDDVFKNCALILGQLKTPSSDLADKNRKLYEKLENGLIELINDRKKLTRSMLLLNAYLTEGQNDLIDEHVEIEHIFPRKWQDTNYNGWSSKDTEIYLEKCGNKILFEKKLNIQAGNGYFNQKKGKYAQSKIQEVLNLSKYPNEDWLKTDIENRDKEIKERLLAFFKDNLK